MLHDNPNAFCANPLDRAGVQRKDKEWLAAQAKDPQARLMLLYKGEVLLNRGPTSATVQWLTLDALGALPMDRELALLGLWDGAPIFAADVSSADNPPLDDVGTYTALRGAAPFLPPAELSVAGQAIWLLDWHRRNRYCAKNGDFTEAAEGGYKRVNPRTGVEHFPRTDPVAIVLPYHEDYVCLGRSPHFPQGFMSAFAGYLEPGETLEQCGERELFEEVGLRARTMEYKFSQPWPFPSSLMMGFIAEVEDKELDLDLTEIEEAAWFTRAEAQAIMDGDHDVMCPPPFAIAHQLLKVWLAQ
ncbi:MAG: NAD(+) diphosphatase [Pseudomonadota bacterium]